MRRVLLLAAAALLGSGCIVHNDNTPSCPPSTITVTWNTFTGGDGLARTCSQAGVASVDIYMNGQPVSTWPCSDGGALITQVQPGTYTLDIEGIEAGTNRIAFRDSQQVNSNGCGDQLVQAQPAEGDVDLQYVFVSQGGNVCAPGSYIWFSVFDLIANAEVMRFDETNSPRAYQCSLPIVFSVPAGSYRLSWVEEANPTTLAITGANCTPADFTVVGGGRSALPVDLVDSTTACPH